jgi:membrane fusion protein, heavy metal efflux system
MQALLCLLMAFSLVACSRGQAAREALPLPPYQLVDQTTLRVRDDLARLLAFAPARSSHLDAQLQGFGRLAFAPDASYAVRVGYSAFVERVLVNPGDDVKAGQVLATLRSSEVARLRADVQRLISTIASETDAVERSERLVREGAASDRELVESRTRKASAEAELKGLRESLGAQGLPLQGSERYELRATAAGQVLARNIHPGERVSSDGSEAAFVIGNSKKLVVRASFSERDAPLLEEGASCTFTVSALGGQRFAGTLRRVLRAVEAKTRTADAVCAPNADDPRFRAEMVARVEVGLEGDGVLVVPRQAVLLRRDDKVVFVKKGPVSVERRAIEVGMSIGEQIQILSGLKAGEEVVVENAVLFDGELDRLL